MHPSFFCLHSGQESWNWYSPPGTCTHIDLSSNETVKRELDGLDLFQDHRTLRASLCWSCCTTVTIENWLVRATRCPRTTRAIWHRPVNPANCNSSAAPQLFHPPSKSDKDSEFVWTCRKDTVLAPTVLKGFTFFMLSKLWRVSMYIFFVYVCFIIST